MRKPPLFVFVISRVFGWQGSVTGSRLSANLALQSICLRDRMAVSRHSEIAGYLLTLYIDKTQTYVL